MGGSIAKDIVNFIWQS